VVYVLNIMYKHIIHNTRYYTYYAYSTYMIHCTLSAMHTMQYVLTYTRYTMHAEIYIYIYIPSHAILHRSLQTIIHIRYCTYSIPHILYILDCTIHTLLYTLYSKYRNNRTVLHMASSSCYTLHASFYIVYYMY
jgi:hypothetical protein